MEKYFTPFLFTFLCLSCEETNEKENFITLPLPLKFPLDKEYAWEYMVKDFSSKSDWENSSNPSSIFFDTLFVKPEDSIYSSFWWASNPTYHLLVLNFLQMKHF